MKLQFAEVSRRQFIRYGAMALGTGIVAACTGKQQTPPAGTATQTSGAAGGDLRKITFGTNWYAQAEHGGFYQAVATGIYKDYGLDVTIKMGGPQVNGTQLLMGGAIDFFMGFTADAIKAVEEGIPKKTVAAIFQKDPQILAVHPDPGIKTLADLKGKPIYVSAAANVTYWPFLASKFGFTDDMKRPYNFNPGPFLADKSSVQQGYLSSEPLTIQKEGGFEPTVFLLADAGYSPYGCTIETRNDLIEKDPDLVQRFVDASIKGWYSYFKDPTPANALIKKDNPEMTDEQMAYGVEKMQEYGIVLSGDAEKAGIGAMTADRWQSFFKTMADAGVFKKETDVAQAYTLDFVNKGTAYYQA
ncbi:MAG TPA: ABC transporter substrate-binding protein [Trichocoleus sp.]